MPIRVERRRARGRVFYRLFGIQWGGRQPTDALAIRFADGAPAVNVDECPRPPGTRTWSFWRHDWHPAAPGEYAVSLSLADPRLRSLRLDRGFYTRRIVVSDDS
jgi:hypothetical protein